MGRINGRFASLGRPVIHYIHRPVPFDQLLGLYSAADVMLVTALRDGMSGPFQAAVETIRKARGRVIVTGMGKSGHVARKIAATFASTGTPAFFVHPSEASHGDLGMITPDDVIMALSWSGETSELRDLTDFSRRFRIGLIALTASADSATLARRHA